MTGKNIVLRNNLFFVFLYLSKKYSKVNWLVLYLFCFFDDAVEMTWINIYLVSQLSTGDRIGLYKTSSMFLCSYELTWGIPILYSRYTYINRNKSCCFDYFKRSLHSKFILRVLNADPRESQFVFYSIVNRFFSLFFFILV